MTIYYVAGYGRSGSTTLGRVLASEHRALGVGEAAKLQRDVFDPSVTCTCGRTYLACEYWAGVEKALESLTETPRPLRPWIGGLLGLFLPMSMLRRLVDQSGFSPRHPGVTLAQGLSVLVFEAGGNLVDTSKTTRRAANRPRVWRAIGQDVHVVTARRPLQGVIESHRAAQVRHGRRGRWWRSAATVVPARAMALVAARWSARSSGGHATVVHLEEILDRVHHLDAEIPREHLVAGNRGRHEALEAD